MQANIDSKYHFAFVGGFDEEEIEMLLHEKNKNSSSKLSLWKLSFT